MPEKCHVHNCTEFVIAKGLCRRHYMQVQRHGEVVNTRPKDWGQRKKHSAYKAWCGLRRNHLQNLCNDWKDDFWKFAQDVGEKPPNSKAFRSDKSKLWSSDNFYWKENRSLSEDRKEYAREWRKKARIANPDYYLNIDLKKRYGVTLEWYRETFSKQNGVCAICEQPETAKIRGKGIAMAVDHCHTTGKVRGLLCTQCNRALGLFRDDKDNLVRAISYLTSNS